MAKYQITFSEGGEEAEDSLTFGYDPESELLDVTVASVKDAQFRFLLLPEEQVELNEWLRTLPRKKRGGKAAVQETDQEIADRWVREAQQGPNGRR